MVFVGVALAGLSLEPPEPELDPELLFDKSELVDPELDESVLDESVPDESELAEDEAVEDDPEDPESEDPERLSFL